MKQTILTTLLVLSLFWATGCNAIQENDNYENQKSNLAVKFDLSEAAGSKAISLDFSQVYGGKAFLQQKDIVQYQTELIVDNINKTGEGAFSDVVIGNYDIIMELYDSSAIIVYSGTSNVTVLPNNNNTVITDLAKNAVSLLITGNWTEDIPNLATGIIKMKKNVVYSYAGNLVIDVYNKTATGYIINIQPGTYDVYIEIKNTAGEVCFSGMKTVVVDKEHTNVIFRLTIRSGNLEISAAGDVSAPVITRPPNASVTGQDATIAWETNEYATSNICYSTNSGFNYQLTTDWAPIGQDITADKIKHSVTARGLLQDQTYYYVIVSADAAGNIIVSNEYSFVVEAADVGFTDNTVLQTDTYAPDNS